MTIDDARRVRDADGILADANAAGLFAASDLHITSRMVRMCGEPVAVAAQVAIALAVRSVRLGSTCFALTTVDELPGAQSLALPSAAEMLAELRGCPLVVGARGSTLQPVVLMDSDDGPLVYLQKYFRQEQSIRQTLANRATSAPDVDVEAVRAQVAQVFADSTAEPRQRLAAEVAASHWTSILAGGPGTGKTYTVARILAVLDSLAGGDLRIGMCAPTGRAAAQLQASVDLDGTLPTSVRAVTVHSLLGWRPGSTPRYGLANKLPHDVIVVDETSMLSMTAMSRLLDAVRSDARLILVGDPHQLASVEAGAVLADLVERAPGPPSGQASATTAGDPSIEMNADESARLRDGVVTLRRGFRFGGQISRVADAVNRGDADAVVDLVTSADIDDVQLVAPDKLDAVHDDIVAWGTALHRAAHTGDVDAALAALDSHRILCAHREGLWGVRGWQRRVADWLSESPGLPRIELDTMVWSLGEPLLVTSNDRQTGTFNGDCGVVVRAGGETDSDRLEVAFRRGAQERLIAPVQLPDVAPAYAMTIHRSQGSQFGGVTIVLPPSGSELLTRELLYTAITRARTRVRIVGTREVLAEAVTRRVHRASGLRSAVRELA
ncbi:exodeoxyribonuclease V subunit alpha [Gordonia sp. 852002-10350_SCH5691597]|nr:exodeoxyribonuclease V subunit alpha [Gordonia sputi]OBA57204.1 exodeoxyribonuclease V subunit alpha [Gordonia sp. 852002-10350_SCH5691597]